MGQILYKSVNEIQSYYANKLCDGGTQGRPAFLCPPPPPNGFAMTGPITHFRVEIDPHDLKK